MSHSNNGACGCVEMSPLKVQWHFPVPGVKCPPSSMLGKHSTMDQHPHPLKISSETSAEWLYIKDLFSSYTGVGGWIRCVRKAILPMNIWLIFEIFHKEKIYSILLLWAVNSCFKAHSVDFACLLCVEGWSRVWWRKSMWLGRGPWDIISAAHFFWTWYNLQLWLLVLTCEVILCTFVIDLI